MDQIKVYYDEIGRTLTVWFDDPAEESLVTPLGAGGFPNAFDIFLLNPSNCTQVDGRVMFHVTGR